MSSAAECPSTDVLNRLLAGSLSNGEADRVSRHVDGCLACQHLLDGSDNLSIVVERMVPGVVGDYGPAFYRALDALLAAQSASATEAFHPFFARLLEPSNDHRYLGRLGHYDVISPLGHGGMGIVLRAHDAVLNREVALKILAPHLSHQPNARERFAREARAAAAINHDNVLSIHAVSEAAGLPYLVMPYIIGTRWQRESSAKVVCLWPKCSRSLCKRCSGWPHGTSEASCIGTSSHRTCCSKETAGE